MAVIQRVTDFIPNTLIESQEVDDEFNQLVNLLSGVSTDKDTLLRYSHAADPVLRVDQLGAGLIQQWLQNGAVRASLSGLGKLLLPAGIGATPSTDQISNFGTYFIDPNIRATIANTTETDFSSKTIAANVLANDGDFIVFLIGVNYAANGNSKRFRIYFGVNVLFDTGAVVLNGVNHLFVGYLFRRATTNLTGMIAETITTAAFSSGVNLAAQDFTIANILKTTGLNGTASANDIRQFGAVVIKGSV